MNYKEMKDVIEQMATENYREFIKALLSFEKNVEDEDLLDMVYEEYMDNDYITLINEDFDYMINKYRSE